MNFEILCWKFNCKLLVEVAFNEVVHQRSRYFKVGGKKWAVKELAASDFSLT